ncbi:MAG: hypothetical protein H0T73_07285 [Ardenticatenales bacterium]|nr:hypothetical protein [Ardenticatenales bacterium]
MGITTTGGEHLFSDKRAAPRAPAARADAGGSLRAPMPGTIVEADALLLKIAEAE